MAANKHTPAEWVYSAENGEVYYDDPDQIMPLVATVNFANTSKEQADADGQLIAAAPALLAALRAVMDGQIGGDPDMSAERFVLARAAIAKAGA